MIFSGSASQTSASPGPAAPARVAALLILMTVLPAASLGGFASVVSVSNLAADETATPASPAPAAPVYCPVCGAANKAGSKFCQNDGAPLPALESTRFLPSYQQAAETLPTEEIQAAVQQSARSVVRIRVKAKADFRYPDLTDDRELGYLAEDKDENRWIGSGFVIEDGGWVITNAHVAAPLGTPAEVGIDTVDGGEFPARVVGVDPASDLALLQADKMTIPPLSWGDSEGVQLGEETWAIGNPLDIGLSLTRGTISSMVRIHVGMNQVENFLHSDAFITSGNSGGPLVSVRGLVLGVNDMAYTGTKGQGYSIPARTARLVTGKIREGGAYKRGFLGLQVHPIDSESVKKYSIQRRDGVVVESVLAGTPAQAAGFLPGDVIYGIDNRAIRETYLLQEAVSSVGPSQELLIQMERSGKTSTVRVLTGLRPATPRIDSLQDLERYLQASFIEDPKKKRVVIQSASAFSLAVSYGFYPGDRVDSVLPARDWSEKPLSPEVYRAAHPTEVRTLDDLRRTLGGMYRGGRIGVAMGLHTDRSRPNESIVQAFVMDETWPIIV